MNSEAVVIAIAVAVIGVIGTVTTVLLKNSNKSPETKDAQTNAWGQLNDRLNKHLDWLTTRVTSLETESEAKNQRISTLDNRVDELESEVAGFRALTAWLRARVAQLSNHITEGGGVPPEPPNREPGA